jgi:crotonobetainyl-CoA:carnitine CoA-transferase CaiB-like acyl-CoA transferase
MDDLPLAGVRVLDFTRAVAGPYTTTLLACLGAEVIKVESRSRPDIARLGTSSVTELDSARLFIEMNVNKLSVSINLSKPAGKDLVLRLAKRSDVVIENMQGGALERMGLGYEVLSDANPRLIVLSAPTAGVGGPAGNYAGVATIFTALSGCTNSTGYEDGPPALISDIFGDPSSGTAMAFAVLAALHAREQDGKGQFIDYSHIENLASYLGPAYIDMLASGREWQRLGNADAVIAPHGVYRCRGEDHWIAITAESEEEWRACAAILELNACLADPRFADAYLRLCNHHALDMEIGRATALWEAHALADALQSGGVAASPVWSWEEIAQGQQLRSRGMLQVVEHPRIGPIFALGLPWVTEDMQMTLHSAGPILGAHNDYVLREVLGISDAEVEELTRAQVIE